MGDGRRGTRDLAAGCDWELSRGRFGAERALITLSGCWEDDGIGARAAELCDAACRDGTAAVGLDRAASRPDVFASDVDRTARVSGRTSPGLWRAGGIDDG